MGTKKLFHSKSVDRKCSGIYKKIEHLLQEHNMSVYRFSEYIGISENTIHNWKYGTTVPCIKYLIAIADYFDVSLDYLCGRG